MSNVNPPNHRFDTSTGWRVFAPTPDTETVYGNFRLKWTDENQQNGPPLGRYARIMLHISTDNGQTWNKENSMWTLHHVVRSLIGSYHDNTSPLNEALLAARSEWNIARRKELDRKRRAELNALPPEQKALVKAERTAAWKLRKEKAEERKMKRTALIMDQIIHFGPELVRLKEDIDALLATMAKGGMDRPLAYYGSRRRWINGAKWYINGYCRDIEEAQKRTAGKKNTR